MGKRKRKDEQQLKLLNCGDALELAKFKKRTKLKAVRVFSSKEQEAEFFDNRILITVEELATIFRVSSQTIRNWVARGKIPHIQIGRRNLFQMRSLQKWLNQKEEPLWE
ncbi:MAG: helix-turn-helix domain-containing protein [Oligoflexia bacterium]|nr:helix-turn-helix domain-containing protein [Oligoflexia bacterium]